MADTNFMEKFKRGQLNVIDELPHLDPALGPALETYSNVVTNNRQSYKWIQAVQWIENILFGLGRQYIDDLLVTRISRDASTGDLSVGRDFSKRIPKPINDFIGRYVETNIALLTENRPQPRITPKSESRDDRQKAELSQLTLEYMWEEHQLPEKLREVARILMYCGVCFTETVYDPTEARHLAVPETKTEQGLAVPAPGGQIVSVPTEREVDVIGPDGLPKLTTKVEYGDVVCNVVSPFELHFPQVHWWQDIDWVMKETYVPIQTIRDRYLNPALKPVLTKKNGWNLGALEKISRTNVQTLPLWWWERMANIVEGPGPSIYVGNPELWDDYCVVKVFDRKPSPKWPNGRTVITVGGAVLYDSPIKVGARAYDPRWPHRWHPYVRYRWEAQIGSIFGRSLVSKLLPKVKRINAIDTALIMWRRTVPIATWIAPKGTNPVEDLNTGRPGGWLEYDPRKTNNMEPKPVYPPPFPEAALAEREMCKQEMEAMAGTEDVLRGQRPTGVNSAAMLDVLRKQALSSRSAILQAWDESLQFLGSAILQEVIKNVKNDSRFAERIKILAREKASRFTIDSFSGADLSDNVIVRVDTASMAMVSREAKQARAIEIIQYGSNLVQLPTTLQKKLMDDLGWPDTMNPKSADITRAQTLISFIKSNRFDLAIPFPEDDPYVLHEFFVEAIKEEAFIDYPQAQQIKMLEIMDYYKGEIERIEKAQLQMQFELQQAQMDAAGGGQTE